VIDSTIYKSRAGIAQVVEQKTENLCVGGSTPSPGTTSIKESTAENTAVF
jgi:hypothetical protein